jgi:hypothetical protein
MRGYPHPPLRLGPGSFDRHQRVSSGTRFYLQEGRSWYRRAIRS